jgi:hypothetical protein
MKACLEQKYQGPQHLELLEWHLDAFNNIALLFDRMLLLL